MKRLVAPHAHALEDKAARRSAILQAAATLFRAGPGTLPTAAEIAVAAGLAKGTVYLYFRTKEEIFAALLLEDWGAVMDRCQLLFKASQASRAAKVDAFLSALVAHVEAHTELLRLDALGYGVLERNMPLDALTAHKADYMVRLEETGRVIDLALRLEKGRGVQLLMRTYALTRGLWQSYQHAAETLLAGVHVADSLMPNPFGVELHEALIEYWRGALPGVMRPRVKRQRQLIGKR